MTKAAAGSRSTRSKSVSRLTPLQRMSSFAHLVTQLISTVQSRGPSAWNAAQSQLMGSRTRPSIENDQRSSGMRGVGPAERTGKSLVRYWPGGTRPAAPVSGVDRRPTKPRVTNRSVISPPPFPSSPHDDLVCGRIGRRARRRGFAGLAAAAGALLEQLRDERRPARLVGRAKPAARVAVGVLVEEDEVVRAAVWHWRRIGTAERAGARAVAQEQ